MYLNVCAKRIPEQNAFVVIFRSIEGDTWFDGTIIEKHKFPKTGEVTVKYGGLFIEVIDGNKQ